MARSPASALAVRPPRPAARFEIVEAMPAWQFSLYAIAGVCFGTVAVLCIRPFFAAIIVIGEALR